MATKSAGALLEAFVRLRLERTNFNRELATVRHDVTRNLTTTSRHAGLIAGRLAGRTWGSSLLSGAKSILSSGAGRMLTGALFGGGAIGATVAGLKTVGVAFDAMRPVIDHVAEGTRLWLRGVTADAPNAANQLERMAAAYGKVRIENEKALAAAQSKFAAAVQPAIGPFQRLVPGLNPDEIAAHDANRAILEKQRAAAVERFQTLMFSRDSQGREGRTKFVEAGINKLRFEGKSTAFMRPELGKQFDAQVAQANKDIADANRRMTLLDQQIDRVKNMRIGQARFQQTLADVINKTATAGSQAVNAGAAFATGQASKFFTGMRDRSQIRLPFMSGGFGPADAKGAAESLGKLFGDAIGKVAGTTGPASKMVAKGLGNIADVDQPFVAPQERRPEFVGLSDMARKIQSSMGVKTGPEARSEQHLKRIAEEGIKIKSMLPQRQQFAVAAP